MSYHFTLFLYFAHLYISLIYGVFLNKILQVFYDDDDIALLDVWTPNKFNLGFWMIKNACMCVVSP